MADTPSDSGSTQRGENVGASATTAERLIDATILVTFETIINLGRPMLDLDDFLPYRLSVLSNRISEGIAQTYRKRFGLSVTEWRAIAIVGRYPRISATEVAQRSAMDKVAVSRAVKNLLERGLLEREASDSDRRAKHLTLSDHGQDVYDRIVPEARAYERRLLAALDPKDHAALDRAIDRLAAAAGQAPSTPASTPPPETA